MTRLTEIFLQRPVTSVMTLLTGILLGLYSYPFLSLGLMPNTNPPGLTITTRYPGVAPGKIEEVLTKPIEEEVAQVTSIEDISSQSEEGESKIDIIFIHSVDLKKKIIEVQERLEKIAGQFPREVEKPYIVPYDPNNRPIFILSLSSEKYDLKQLREIADKQIKNLFSRIEGVSEVFVSGGFIREIHVEADPLKLLSYKISLDQLSQIIQSGNIFLPSGKIKDNGEERNIVVSSKYKTIDEIRNIPIPFGKDQVVSLGSIANVKDGFREPENISKTNGRDKVSIYIEKTGTGNTLAISKLCNDTISKLKLEGIKTGIDYDQGAYMRKALDRVQESIISGGIIAMIVLMLFLRSVPMTFIIGISIPSSIIITYFLLYLWNIELNVITLSGLALGTGMLVDNAIVVTEKISRNHGTVRDHELILESVKRVAPELIASSLSTVIVFLPLVFSDEKTRLLYKDLAISISASLLVSLFFSLTILPSLVMQFHKLDFSSFGKKLEKYNLPVIKKYTALIRRKYVDKAAVVFHRLQKKVSGIADWGINKVKDKYMEKGGNFSSQNLWYETIWKNLIKKAVEQKKITLAALLAFLIIGAGALYVAKKAYMDPMDSGEVHASIEVDVGTTLDATAEIISRIESLILAHEAVERVNSKIEKWHATIYIKIKEEYKFKITTDELIDDLKKITKPVQSAFVYFNESSEDDSSKELDVHIYGPDPEKLKFLANEVAAKLKQNILDVEMVVLRFRPGKPSLEIHPKPIELSRVAMNSGQLGGILRSSLYGSVSAKFYDKDKEVDIRIHLDPKFSDTPEKIKLMYINLKDNHTPIDTLAYFTMGDEETKIYRFNKIRMVTLTAKFRKMDINTAGNAISEVLDTYPFEKDYKYELGDSFTKLQKSQSEVLIITLLSIVLIYLLLGILFESATWPLLIIVTVPLCVLFTVIVLVSTNNTLNMSVYIGLILMGGIVVNNTILVVSTIKHKLKTSQYSPSLVFAAIKERVRPITMSTITNVLGMAPLIFDYKEGSNLWRPLALTLTIGILFSLIVSLYLIPVIYGIFKTLKLPWSNRQ